jgi:hypothetical protein
MKIKFMATYRDASDDTAWTEDYETNDAGTAEEIIGRLLDNFNATLRPGQAPRRVVKILAVEGSAQLKHNWDKASLVTEKGGYDRMRCRVCGAKGKRYGLGQHGVTIDKRARKSCPGYDL